MNMNLRLLPSALALALVACGAPESPQAPAAQTAAPVDQPAEEVPPQSAADVVQERLDGVLAGAWRSAGNRARDAFRHPKETLEFFGVKPGDTVVEITPGAGWYTEILAPLQKGSGRYIGAIPLDASSDYAAKGNARLREKLAGDADAYGEATLVEFDPKAPSFGAPESADVVLTFRNVHNWGDGAPAMFKGFFDVLKPGGTLGVVDHRAAAGATAESVADSGYLPTDYVIGLATGAGFVLAGQSEINANPKDTKDHEKGVWTLPPSLALGDTDREKYLAIGESDRMTLKFVKPKGDGIFSQGAEAAAEDVAGKEGD